MQSGPKLSLVGRGPPGCKPGEGAPWGGRASARGGALHRATIRGLGAGPQTGGAPHRATIGGLGAGQAKGQGKAGARQQPGRAGQAKGHQGKAGAGQGRPRARGKAGLCTAGFSCTTSLLIFMHLRPVDFHALLFHAPPPRGLSCTATPVCTAPWNFMHFCPCGLSCTAPWIFMHCTCHR